METMLLPTKTDHKQHDAFRTISQTSLLTGTLHLAGASIYFYLTTATGQVMKLDGVEASFIAFLDAGGPAQFLRYVARAVFDASTNDKLLLAWGLVLHYMIAFLFCSIFFLLYPWMGSILKKKAVSTIVYGLFAWSIMQLVVLPVSNHKKSPSGWSDAITSGLLVTLTIGLPVALITHRFYRRKQNS